MDELLMNRTFVQVVESGSFSAAARLADTSVTSVARQINGIEARLGVRLIHRTTRRQSLTEAGEIYYRGIVDVLGRLDGIKQDVTSYQSTVKGRLNVHLRSSVGNRLVVPALPRFLEAHPDLKLEITLTDERVDLVANGVDVAVWLGALEDSTTIARQLNPGRRVLCASPAYLDAHGTPKRPKDLADHNCLVFSVPNYGSIWRFVHGEDVISVSVSGNLATGSGAVLQTAVLSGIGLAILQEAIVEDLLLEGKLVRVLPEYTASPTELDTALYVVYPSGRNLAPKTRAFVDFLVGIFKSDH
jgi:DNA-binding transcriptional LysR family regulator